MGDILIWANKDDVYGYAKSTPESGEVTVTLKNKPGKGLDETIVMEAPAEQAIKELAPEKIAENAKRLAHEDSIRNAYMATFISESDAKKFAEKIS